MPLSDKEKAEIREEAERRVDVIFLKSTGRTWREPELAARNGDSFGQIQRDFPSLFGGTAA